MLRSNLFASVMALSLACLAPLSAAQAQMKIGVVDFRRLLGESPQIKALQATLDQEFDGRRRELLQLQSDLKAKDAKYQRDAAIMSEGDKNKAQKELLDGQRDFTRKQNEFKEDAERRQNEELDKIQRVLALEVEGFAKSQNFDLVIAKEVVLFRKDAVDVTSQIVAAIQSKAPKAAAPAAPAPKP
jgi:outer membrane protein